MKELLLIRHAKSSWNNPELSDFDRPLSERGYQNAELMAKRLVDNYISFDYMISSPAKRAKSTALITAKKAGFPSSQIVFNEDVYMASLLSLVDIIRDVPSKYSKVALVGHNPNITELINYLVGESIENLPTGFHFLMSFPIQCWSGIKSGSGIREYFNYPKSKSETGVSSHRLPVI